MTMMDHLRQYLDTWVMLRQPRPEGWRFSCIEDLVLQHGTPYEFAACPYEAFPKACYDRAYDHATRRKSPWIYVEGYAANSKAGLPVPHAWITRADQPGKAFELAWGFAGDPEIHTAYLGVPIQAGYVRKCHRKSKGGFYSVFDTWWMDHPLVTGATPIEEVIWRP